ncbi:DNA polymerase III subunit alpha, partial [bacterium]|nr:DNA polymerase III subunit alpha [bacterium]
AQTVKHRLEYEFSIICQKGFSDYFLLVHEIVQEAERQGHRVLGRGSAANSLISYSLRLTHVDPLKNNLFFERFLNPERSSPPDIDLDFSWKIRDTIYEFLRKRWGKEQVALISTHVTMRGRGALWEAGKALGFQPKELEGISRVMGSLSAQEFLEHGASRPETRGFPFKNLAFLRLIKIASAFEGIPKNLSLHAGGVVVSPGSIYRFTPVQPSSKSLPMTQMEMRAIEEVGLVKIDILAQRSLGVFSDVSMELKTGGCFPEELENIDLISSNDSVANALKNGRTIGVFYIESPGMRGLLKKLGCRGFSELTAASSVIRPGVAESGMMAAYIERHLKQRAIPPQNRLLEPILKETHGVMIYQEDVMRVAQVLSGLTLGEADILRRAMSGKSRNQESLIELKNRFLSGASKRGVSLDFSNEIWRQIESFSGYAFCKAH